MERQGMADRHRFVVDQAGVPARHSFDHLHRFGVYIRGYMPDHLHIVHAAVAFNGKLHHNLSLYAVFPAAFG